MYQVKVTEGSSLSKVQQITAAFIKDIHNGILKENTRLPSINEFSDANAVARDTIEKAYRELKAGGYVVAYPGRGIFVAKRNKKKLRVLLVFNKISSFKKIVYDAIVKTLGANAKVDLCIHHYNPALLKEIVDTHIGKYDYYVVMPHFFAGAKPETYRKVLQAIPANELIVLDKDIPDWSYPIKRIYQDFKNDIYEALNKSEALLKKYQSISLVFPDNTNHPKEIIEGIQAYCQQQNRGFNMVSKATEVPLANGTVYIVIEEDDLANLIKRVRTSGLIPGKDIGIISFNETVLKELLDITVFTTDFEAMGCNAAYSIAGKPATYGKNPFHTIYRGSL